MPTRSGHIFRGSLEREGIFWRPPSGWEFRRPSRSHCHSHRWTTSLRELFSQGSPQSFGEGGPSNRHSSCSPDYAEFMRRQFPSSGEGAFDDSNDRAQSLRATAWSRSFQHTPEVFERPRQSGHSRSVSEPRDSITSSNRRDDAPQKATTYPGCGDDVPQSAVTDPSYDYDAPRSTVDNPNHDDNVAERYSHIPEHIRQHPRFEEVAYAAEMIEKFEEQDPRAKSFEKLLEEIIEEINKDIGDL